MQTAHVSVLNELLTKGVAAMKTYNIYVPLYHVITTFKARSKRIACNAIRYHFGLRPDDSITIIGIS